MKLKNLFLVGLTAMAMASCSNENDPTENGGGNTAADAKMLFSFSMPGSVATKAQGTQEGTTEESAVKTINLRIHYSTADATDGIYNFKVSDFKKDATGKTYTLKDEKKMNVKADTNAKVYVTVNGDLNVNTKGTTTATYDANASISSGVAEDGNFLMTGSSQNPVKIDAGQVNHTGAIAVSRVVARIDETTTTVSENLFTFTTVYKKDGKIEETATETFTAEIEGYAIANLNKNTNIFELTTLTTPDYFQALILDKNNSEKYGDYVSKTIGTTKTYCLENDNATQPTSVIYKVSYKYADGNKVSTFFKYDGKIYKTFDALDETWQHIFSADGLSEKSTYDQLIAKGIQKYENGIAYYTQNITTESIAKIQRNNIYQLKVNKITGLGDAVIDKKDDGKPTYLILEVKVNDWTVNENSFDLH